MYAKLPQSIIETVNTEQGILENKALLSHKARVGIFILKKRIHVNYFSCFMV